MLAEQRLFIIQPELREFTKQMTGPEINESGAKEAGREKAPELSEFREPYYTFSFRRYHSQKLDRHHFNYMKKMKQRLKMGGCLGLGIFVIGNIYPLLMYIEYDVNVYKPRVSEYLLNRLN